MAQTDIQDYNIIKKIDELGKIFVTLKFSTFKVLEKSAGR